MPPYHAARCCTTYRFDEALTDVERDTFLTWLAQGAPEGDPAAAPATPPRPVGGLSLGFVARLSEHWELVPEVLLGWSPVRFNGEVQDDRRVGAGMAQLAIGVARVW